MRSISDLNPCADPENFPDLMPIFRNFTEILIILKIFEEEGMSGLLDFPLDPLRIKQQVIMIIRYPLYTIRRPV